MNPLVGPCARGQQHGRLGGGRVGGGAGPADLSEADVVADIRVHGRPPHHLSDALDSTEDATVAGDLRIVRFLDNILLQRAWDDRQPWVRRGDEPGAGGQARDQ